MRSVVDERLRRESVRFTLRFTCEACAHFDRDGIACSNGFPTEPHRGTDLETSREVVFCKLFELG